MLTPVLADLGVELPVFGTCLGHGAFVCRKWHGGSPLGVGHQQRQGLTGAVTPGGDVITLQTVSGMLIPVMRQLRLTAHRLLRIFVGVVEAAGVGCHANQTGDQQYTRCFQEIGQLLLPEGLHAKGNHQEEHQEKKVIAHLDMVGRDLKGGEKHEEQSAQQIFFPIDVNQTRDRGRDIGQGDELPDMPRRYQDEEVGGESPDNSPQGAHQR